MQWSSKATNLAATVLKGDAAEYKILKHTPMHFDAGSQSVLDTYSNAQLKGSDFQMSDIVKAHTGVKQVEEKNNDEIIQVKILEKLQEVQEEAYKEAYSLGIEEGSQKAFAHMNSQIQAGLDDFSQLIQRIQKMKTEVFHSNERHIVELAFHMAKLLAKKEISEKPENIIPLMKSAVQMAQDEEDVKVFLSAENYEFIQVLIQQNKQDVAFLEKMKVLPRESLAAGDCVVETNYGTVDSRIEQRAQTLWTELGQIMPSGLATDPAKTDT